MVRGLPKPTGRKGAAKIAQNMLQDCYKIMGHYAVLRIGKEEYKRTGKRGMMTLGLIDGKMYSPMYVMPGESWITFHDELLDIYDPEKETLLRVVVSYTKGDLTRYVVITEILKPYAQTISGTAITNDAIVILCNIRAKDTENINVTIKN